MNIIIVGCGKIGSTIIKSLLAEGHNITVIDNDPAVITEVTNVFDVMTLCGSGIDSVALTEADVAHSDLLISVTGSDEFNMLTCFIARKLGAKHTIARIRNPEYNEKSLGFLKDELRLSLTINPERLVAREIFNILKLPTAVKIEPFSRGSFEMIEVRLKNDSELDGVSLMELKKKYPENFLICAVQRGDSVYIPSGNFVLKGGDKIGITASPAAISGVLKKLGLMQRQARNIMILGATRTTYYLAKMLTAVGSSVKIIDPDIKRCAEFSELLPKAVIINGDIANQDLLLEEGIKSVDAFVSLTGIDEENILLSYFASMQNVPKIISKIDRSEFLTMAAKLGIDCIASPRRSVTNVIVRYARALQNSIGSKVETLYKLMDDGAEALEFEVKPDCKIINIPFKNLPTRPNILVAGIVRGRKTVIPTGEDMILPEDRVVVLSANGRLNDLSDIVSQR